MAPEQATRSPHVGTLGEGPLHRALKQWYARPGDRVPGKVHVHAVMRTPNGNDYGKDLLRQHYLQHDHSHPHTPHRMGKV